VLGPTHPQTLVSRLGLGLTRADGGDLRGAESIVFPALREALAAHGTHSPVTTALRSCAGSLHAAAGRVDEAREALQHAVAESEHQLGNAHPDTAALRDELLALPSPAPMP
jgi:hypothetical protein